MTVFSALVTAACNSLDVQNPNDLDRGRVFTDPNAIQTVTAGALRTWFNAYTRLEAATLSTQARTLTMAWNNAEILFYSSVDDENGIALAPNDTAVSPDRWTRLGRPWDNSPGGLRASTVGTFWEGGLSATNVGGYRPGFHAVLSSANEVLIALRRNGVVVKNATTTRQVETMAVFLQGASLMMLALNYDKGYILDENTSFATSGAATSVYANRAQLRDAAVARLREAAVLADANSFALPASWTNNEASYTNAQIRQVANTMAAMTLAWYPRDDTENAQVDWSRVASFAIAGMSSGAPVDFAFQGDGVGKAWYNETLLWCNQLDTCRVSTRVAHFMDPSSQKDPWLLGVGNPPPTSPDKRLGDGSFGDASMVASFGNAPRTASRGTDFAWSVKAIFPAARGYYHQSSIGFIRHDATGVQSLTGVYGGYGRMPVITATMSDLIWAEALLRQGAAGAEQAATLINKTRVGRGSLPPASASDPVGSDADGPCMANGILARTGGACTLFSKLLYEYEVELLTLGAAPFYNQRRLPVLLGGGAFDAPNGTKRRYIQGLLPGTPREMPVPHVELTLKNEPVYTWGGRGALNSRAP